MRDAWCGGMGRTGRADSRGALQPCGAKACHPRAIQGATGEEERRCGLRKHCRRVTGELRKRGKPTEGVHTKKEVVEGQVQPGGCRRVSVRARAVQDIHCTLQAVR